MKRVALTTINRTPEIKTHARVLDALLAEEVGVMMACGGRGLCATCHVYVDAGQEALTDVTAREQRTLSRLTSVRGNSRLACQARVCGEGVRVSLPEGLYVVKQQDLESMIGKRPSANILHPITGRILAEKGKIITRSFIMQLSDLDYDVSTALAED